MMFVVVQIPFADLRSLTKDGHGRTPKPEWQSDSASGFVRGFGKVGPRTSSSLGLLGEHQFADMNNAVRYPTIERYKERGWTSVAEIVPWFRRLYFDGYIAGRYELGFLLLGPNEEINASQPAIDTQELAASILSIRTLIHSPDTSVASQSIASCARPLSLAYLAASTRQNCMVSHPPGETINHLFFSGEPLVHIRISSSRSIRHTRDRRVISNEADPLLFISSAAGAQSRGNLIVQSSASAVWKETAEERVLRVLTSHLASVVFACDKMVSTAAQIDKPASRDYLRKSVAQAIERLCAINPDVENASDPRLASALQAYGRAYKGRVDHLTDRLQDLAQEWGKPTWTERASSAIAAVRDSIIKSVVDKGVELATKGSVGG